MSLRIGPSAAVLLVWMVGGCVTCLWSAPEAELSPADPAPRVSGDLSLEDALKLTLTHNRDLQTVLRRRLIAEGVVAEAWGEALPTASLSATYTRLDEVAAFEIQDRVITIGALDNYSAGLTVEQPVFRGGAVRAALRAAELYQALTDEQIRGALQDVLYAAIAAYYRAQLAHQEHEVGESYVRQADAHLGDVRAKRRHGVASDFNVLRAEVDLANAQTDLTRLANQLEQAEALLLKTIGVSQESDVVLSDRPEYHPLDIDEGVAVERALVSRPDVAGAELTADLQGEAVEAAKSSYWPEVDAFFTYRHARPDPHVSTLDDWGDVWQAGLTVRYSLFDRGREGRLAQERAALEQRRIELSEVREVARFDVRSARLALANAERAVQTQQMNLERAREGLRLAEVSFREGTIDQVALLDATTALTQAQMLYYRSVFAHAMARLDLRRAAGALVPRAARVPDDVDVDSLLHRAPELSGEAAVPDREPERE